MTNHLFNQIFKVILCIIGVAIIILDILFFDKHWIIASIGGLIILVSGVQIHILLYQKDQNPEEIVSKIKETVKKIKN